MKDGLTSFYLEIQIGGRDGTGVICETGAPEKEYDDEVWLPSYVEAHFSARVLLFTSAFDDYTSRFSDYKKFRVESMIVTLKNKKRGRRDCRLPIAD